jgi:hypothetical protein
MRLRDELGDQNIRVARNGRCVRGAYSPREPNTISKHEEWRPACVLAGEKISHVRDWASRTRRGAGSVVLESGGWYRPQFSRCESRAYNIRPVRRRGTARLFEGSRAVCERGLGRLVAPASRRRWIFRRKTPPGRRRYGRDRAGRVLGKAGLAIPGEGSRQDGR